MHELEIDSGCPCEECREARMLDNPRGGRMSPEQWAEREKKAGRGRFDARHFGKDKPVSPSDPHFRVVDRMANKSVLTPLRIDDKGRAVGGCDPMSGAVGDLLPAIKEMQEGHVYHALDARFDLIEDVDQDPSKDKDRMRWGIYDRAAGSLVVPRNKKGEVLTGFKSESAAKRWLSANRKSITKFSCPTTPKGLNSLRKRIEANSPSGKKAKLVEKAKEKAEEALRSSKKASAEYLYAAEVMRAIEAGQPIPERPKKAPKAPKTAKTPEPAKPTPEPAKPTPEPAKPTNGGGPKPKARIPMPGESYTSPPKTSEPESEPRVGYTVDNPGGVTEARVKKIEQRLGVVETGQEKLTTAVGNLNTAVKKLDTRTAAGLRALGATGNVMKAFESGKAPKAKESKPKPKAKQGKPKAKGR